eukprot:6065372-Amphidinium_carterae.2
MVSSSLELLRQPPLAHDGSQLSATIASFRENRDRIIEQLMTENAALRASLDQQALETAQLGPSYFYGSC